MSDEELTAGDEPISDSAPESSNAEEVSQPEQSNRNVGVEKRIGKLTSQLYHKDTELNQLRAEVETLKNIGKTKEPEPQAAVDLPDESLRYDDPDKYRQQLEAYHKAAASRAYQEAHKSFEQQQADARAKAEQEQQQQKFKGVVDSYIEKGLEAGITEDRMLANEQILKQAGIDPGLAERLYSHTDGAKIVDYLAGNPEKLASITQQNIMDAAVSIAVDIAPAALATKSETTNAPDPVSPTVGGGVPPGDNLKWIGGAKFE